MKNPNDIYVHEKEKRLTITTLAKNLLVTPRSVLKWFTKGVMPRKVYIHMLSVYFNTTHDEIINMLTRCHDITNAGYKIPFGQIVSLNMLRNSHNRLKAGNDPFPPDTSIYATDRIEYD